MSRRLTGNEYLDTEEADQLPDRGGYESGKASKKRHLSQGTQRPLRKSRSSGLGLNSGYSYAFFSANAAPLREKMPF
jgi:hypothetical protein